MTMTGPMLMMTAPTTAADRVALGVLNSHVLEDAEVVVGVVGLLATVTLRHDLAGVNVLEQAFLGARDWTLLNGPHSPRGRAGRRRRTRAATFHASTRSPSTAMSTTSSSTSSRAPRVRNALGFIAIIAFLVAALAACSSSGDSSDEWQPEPVSEVDLDENENEPDEYDPRRTRTSRGRTRTSERRTRTSPTRTKPTRTRRTSAKRMRTNRTRAKRTRAKRTRATTNDAAPAGKEPTHTHAYTTLRVARSDARVLNVVINAPPMNLIGPELVRDHLRPLLRCRLPTSGSRRTRRSCRSRTRR